VVDHSWPQEVQKPHVAQRETPEPRMARQMSVWLRLAQQGMTGPRPAILEGLPVWVEEPQGARSPGEPPGQAAVVVERQGGAGSLW
jgi:hypothetical protein